jgi:hypothetical protein
MFASKQKRGWLVCAGLCAVWVLGFSTPGLAQDETAAPDPAIKVHVAFGTDVDRAARTLLGKSESFAAAEFSEEAGQIYCLTRILNLNDGSGVTHVWYYEGKTMARVELPVGSGAWRTWSSKRILPAWKGPWEVKVLDANGMVLASAGFTVE